MRRSLAALALAVVLPAGALLSPAAIADVVVKPGETLSEIADRYGISLNRLMQANGISNPNVVTAGTRLVIPGSRAAGSRAASGRGGSGVSVKDGETLSEIADRYGISLNRLMQANGISNPNIVAAGTRLVIPGSRATAAAPAAARQASGSYTIQSGETLSEIADRTGTSVERLMQLNGISNPNQVVAGTRLAIPGQARNVATSGTRPAANARQHVVKSGETLSHIADDYNVPVEKLISLNKIDDPNMVVAGTRLQLQPPPPVARPKPRTVPVARKPQPATTVARRPAPPAPTAKPQPVAKAEPAKTQPVQSQPVANAERVVNVKPLVKAQPVAKAEPAAQTEPSVQTQPVVKTQPVARTQPAARPKPVATAEPVTKAEPVTTAEPVNKAEPVAKAEPAVRPTQRPTTTTNRAVAAATTAARKPVGPDWRTYGPLQIDWANWRPMGGSFVAPSLGSDGKPHYLAVNCGARKLNATSQSGQWKTWDNPQNDFEQQLVSDICSSKGA